LLFTLSLLGFFPALAHAAAPSAIPFPPPLESYQDEGNLDVWTVLLGRMLGEPFNMIATVIFFLAIIHTFLAPKILARSHRMQLAHEAQLQKIHCLDPEDKIPQHLRQS